MQLPQKILNYKNSVEHNLLTTGRYTSAQEHLIF